MSRQFFILALNAVALSACSGGDPCVASKQVRAASPSGDRVAVVYPGGCPDVVLAPQVTVEFRAAGGGGGVFAIHEREARLEARWLNEDTLEVSYPAGSTVALREPVLRYQDQQVHVVFRELQTP